MTPVDAVTAELEIVQKQLRKVGVNVTLNQLRSLSVSERVTVEQWVTGVLRGARDEAPDVINRWFLN